MFSINCHLSDRRRIKSNRIYAISEDFFCKMVHAVLLLLSLGALDKQNLLSAKNLKKAFSIFADENGDLTVDELRLLLKDSLTQDEEVDDKALNKLLKQVDLDGDGKIRYET